MSLSLKGDNIRLRALEPGDLDFLYEWENDPENWLVSQTLTPFSRFVLEQYLATAQQDIYTVKQLRLVIEYRDKPVGLIDLFDFDPQNMRAGVGILIGATEARRKGCAQEAIALLKEYCFSVLHLHQLYCNIIASNQASILLFQKSGFLITGIKKQWIRSKHEYHDELFLQLIPDAR